MELPWKRSRASRGFVGVGQWRGRRAAPADAGVELKFHDLDIDDATIAAGGTIAQASCNIIAQGTTESTRIGRKCTIRNIGWRYQIRLKEVNDASDPTTGDAVRVILYQDKQTNGATAAVTDILETADYQSFNQLANKGRFRVLMDRTHDINYATLASHGFAADTFDQADVNMSDTFFKAVNIPIEYDNSATDGSIGTQRTNNIGVLLLARVGEAVFDSKMRLRFSDS